MYPEVCALLPDLKDDVLESYAVRCPLLLKGTGQARGPAPVRHRRMA